MPSQPSAVASPQTAATSLSPLTDKQKGLILAAANELIGATILNLRPAFTDPTLAGAADQPVAGAFVSLKRRGRLRSCLRPPRPVHAAGCRSPGGCRANRLG